MSYIQHKHTTTGEKVNFDTKDAEETAEHQTSRCAMTYNSRLWKVRSKGAILVLVISFMVTFSFYAVMWLVSAHFNDQNTAKVYDDSANRPVALAFAVLVFCCPVAGFLADVYFNRYKVLCLGLWLTWTGMLLLNVTLVLVVVFEHIRGVLLPTGGVIAGALVATGMSACAVNALQFGIDQMPDASSEELTAYIHWFMWVISAGCFTAELAYYSVTYCFPTAYRTGYIPSAVQLMVPMTMLSLALCCEFLLRGWLIIEPGCPNSLRMIYRVLKFAATHKYPIRRRAITYTEDEKPSRIDFAKDKYGGPFTTEQVEDVKTFFRIVAVLLSTAAISFSLGWFRLTVSYLSLSEDHTCVSVTIKISSSPRPLVLVVISFYTFIFYPLIRNRIFSMLQRVALSATLTVILSGAILIIDSVRHGLDSDITCMFTRGSAILNHNLWWAIPSNFTVAVIIGIGITAIVEFTSAQSPYSMRSLLNGIMFSIYLFTISLTYGIFAAWKHFPKQISPSCDFYYLLFQFLCAVVGLLVLCIVVRWYKRRRREEEDDQRRIVEAIYDRMLQNQS